MAKLTASSAFLAVAFSVGATTTPYGQAVAVGLALSWVGDAFLLSSRPTPFLAGLGSFLLAHLAYVVAFARLAPDRAWTAAMVLLLTGPALLVWRWLAPHLEPAMRVPVVAYMSAITVMLGTGIGAAAAGSSLLVPVGAGAFYLSDLSVARDRFVHESFMNRAWGLPLYFGAQLLLALSTAAVV